MCKEKLQLKRLPCNVLNETDATYIYIRYFDEISCINLYYSINNHKIKISKPTTFSCGLSRKLLNFKTGPKENFLEKHNIFTFLPYF